MPDNRCTIDTHIGNEPSDIKPDLLFTNLFRHEYIFNQIFNSITVIQSIKGFSDKFFFRKSKVFSKHPFTRLTDPSRPNIRSPLPILSISVFKRSFSIFRIVETSCILLAILLIAVDSSLLYSWFIHLVFCARRSPFATRMAVFVTSSTG